VKPLRIALPPPPRPSGTGAFWDYAAASARDQDTARPVRVRPSLMLARLAREGEQAEQRWDNEGGRNA